MGFSLSVFIIAKNEADRIGDTIRSIEAIADDIVVVDSGSDDDTVAVAENLGARVIFNKWPGYGEQKRFAEQQCRHNWLLNLDADEVVSDALATEIAGFLKDNDGAIHACTMAIVEIYPGEEKPAPFAYALSPVRLYERKFGQYSTSLVHDRVDLANGAVVKPLKGQIYHYSIRSLGHQAEKLLKYADLQVADMIRRKRRPSTLRLFSEFPLSFIKAYIFRRHFLRGAYGYAIAVNYAYFRHMRLVKLLEVTSGRTPVEDVLSDPEKD